MAYAITDQWIIHGGKTKHLEFRQGAITKIKSTNSKIINSRSQKFNAKALAEIDNIIAELEELQVLRRLPQDEQLNKLDEAEEDEKDLEPDEILRKRRLENESSGYSVLKYNQGSVDDNFMQKLKGNYKISEQGDSLMKNLGVSY